MPAFRELNARLDELDANLKFLALATSLRPRLGGVLRWEDGGDLIDLAQRFISTGENRSENIYGALLLRTLAAFERFARQLLEHGVSRIASRSHTYDQLPQQLRNRNTALTGRLLAGIDEPSDYLPVDYDLLVQNLASCTAGSTSFRLNAVAFVAIIGSGRPSALEKALKAIDIAERWDAVGGNAALQTHLGTRAARATGNAAKARLEELWRVRNVIAHAGEGEGVATDETVRSAIDFVRTFARALNDVVNGRLP
jgi:hypothetical protein